MEQEARSMRLSVASDSAAPPLPVGELDQAPAELKKMGYAKGLD